MPKNVFYNLLKLYAANGILCMLQTRISKLRFLLPLVFFHKYYSSLTIIQFLECLVSSFLLIILQHPCSVLKYLELSMVYLFSFHFHSYQYPHSSLQLNLSQPIQTQLQVQQSLFIFFQFPNFPIQLFPFQLQTNPLHQKIIVHCFLALIKLTYLNLQRLAFVFHRDVNFIPFLYRLYLCHSELLLKKKK